MIYEQERWIYERRTSQHVKKAIIRADISVSFGNKTITCATVDQEFDGMHKQLPGIRLTDQGIQHHALNFKLKHSTNRSELTVDKLPPNKDPNFHPTARLKPHWLTTQKMRCWPVSKNSWPHSP